MTIWKFPIEVTDEQHVNMPRGAKVLTVQFQAGSITIWALVDPTASKVKRRVRVVGTGNPCDVDRFDHIGSVQTPPFVWHVFIDQVAASR